LQLLGEKLQNYCSSSEDEGEEDEGGSGQPPPLPPPPAGSRPRNGGSANTGPKGVLKVHILKKFKLQSVLQIRDVDPGSKFFTSRIRIKEFTYFNPKNCFQALGNMFRVVHPGSGS
jgi:hypothetical protein